MSIITDRKHYSLGYLHFPQPWSTFQEVFTFTIIIRLIITPMNYISSLV